MSQHRYLKKEALLEKIISLGVSKEEAQKLSRNQMIDRLDSEAAIAQAVSESTVTNTETPAEKIETIPSPISPEWTPFLLSKLSKEELIDNHPTCDGLRRLFKIYFGDIKKSKATVVDYPRVENEHRATILYEIEYRSYENEEVYQVADVADCFPGNTNPPYCNFPTATATTMAEGRCLRKAMGLKVITKEESQTVSEEELKIKEETELASTNQKNLILKVAQRNEIDINKLLNYMNNIKSKTIDLLSNIEAKEVLNELNKMQRGPDQGGKIIPTEVMI